MKSCALKLSCAALAGALIALAGLGGSYTVPLTEEAIQYEKTPVDDPVTRLQRRLDSGEVKLNFDENHGYLSAVLKALGVPVESQVLVFSKTSFQAPRISPRMPRALYFNDRVSVGFVRGGDVIEVAAQDPKQGTIFYTLDQEQASSPKFERNDHCLQCHHSGSTLGVPGLVVSSVYPDASGMPLFQNGTKVVNHTTPFSERWGGWYVTGTHGSQTHHGNAVVRDKSRADQLETEGTQNVTDLGGRFDTGAYPTPNSDIVALMVLEHQTHMTNLITRVGWETRMAESSSRAINKALGEPENVLTDSATRRINNAAEELVEYLLFSKEAALGGPVLGSSSFAKEFEMTGPRDKRGRSLREFDLKTRLFKHPCSYMVYSEAFQNMPVLAKERIVTRLRQILSGADQRQAFRHLSAQDRQAIAEILESTGVIPAA